MTISKRVAKRIIALILMCIAITLLLYSFDVHAEGELRIDPNSISGGYEKEGNVLAVDGFVVFTEESMEYTRAIKKKEETERQEMIDGLFNEEWSGEKDYEEVISEIVDNTNLFSDNIMIKNTTRNGDAEKAETVKETNRKWLYVTGTLLIMLMMSVIVIAWRKNRDEHNSNDSAR